MKQQTDSLLFFGFLLNEELRQKLEHCPEKKYSLFIREFKNGCEEYLCIIERGKKKYVGKRLCGMISTEEIPVLQRHIHSILVQLIPQYLEEKLSFFLFPLQS